MAQTQVIISASSGNLGGAVNSAAVFSSLQSILASRTTNKPVDASNKLLTEEDLRKVESKDLVLLNGFTATSAKQFWNAGMSVIGIVGLKAPQPDSPTSIKILKIADLPVSVATGTISCINGITSSRTGFDLGYATLTEMFANAYMLRGTKGEGCDIASTFLRFNASPTNPV